jgi:sulfate transport system substrate-binding protein
VIPALKAYASSKFFSGVKFFKVSDLGGWGAVDKKFFGKGGTWDQIFRKTR